jgi:hypothetical protein
MKWDEYNFILVDFAYVIPILTIPLFSHYMYIKCFFLSMTPKKGWKVVLWKEPYQKWIIDNV